MHRLVMLIAAATLIACGQPATNASADSAPPPPRIDDMEQGGGGGAGLETQSAFVARCTRELIAANPQSRTWAPGQCEQDWQKVVAAGPMADAILAAVPAPGERVAGAQVRARVSSVQWAGRPEGTLVAQGRLGESDVQVEAATMNFFWDRAGEPIPFDVLNALRGRAADVVMIGCAMLGVGETNQVYRVTAPGRAPFQLSVYGREAPTANANAFYNVGVTLNGQIATIAQMRADGSEVTPTCPY
jgi:hypothetical protein